METMAIKPDGVDSSEKSNNADMVKGFRHLFVTELKEVYWSEGAVKKPLHKMIRHTTSNELMNELTRNLDAVKHHQTRLEQVFLIIGEKIEVVKSKAMEGLIKEVEKTMDETKKGFLKDAGIISAALKIKHYGIASYGLLCFYARTLGEDNAATLLRETLEQEKDANEMLSKIIESITLQVI